MRQLHHHPLDPHSRFIRLLLAEKNLDFERVEEPFWLRRESFLKLSPAGTLPVLVEASGRVLHNPVAIGEFIEETAGLPPLLGTSPFARSEVRSLVEWFCNKFAYEVSTPIMYERLWKRLSGNGTPDTNLLRNAGFNIRYHLQYIKYLTERRAWLAGDYMSLADFAAAAQLSSLDYLGSVPWDIAGEAKEWYAKMKCRPSFRPLLQDHVPGLPPAPHYTNLDF